MERKGPVRLNGVGKNALLHFMPHIYSLAYLVQVLVPCYSLRLSLGIIVQYRLTPYGQQAQSGLTVSLTTTQHSEQ